MYIVFSVFASGTLQSFSYFMNLVLMCDLKVVLHLFLKYHLQLVLWVI